MNATPVGLDIAKSVFQVHYIDPETGEIVSRQIKRAQLLEYFANRAPCRIGMEACGSAHHWARQLMQMGHEVKLMPARFVNRNRKPGSRSARRANRMTAVASVLRRPVASRTASGSRRAAPRKVVHHTVREFSLTVSLPLRQDSRP